MDLQLVTPPVSPSGYVISLTDAKLQCRVDTDAEDSLLLKYIAGAQGEVEKILGRALSEQVWKMTLQGFPSGSRPIRLPRPPLISLDSITYVDANGDEQALTGYVLDSTACPAEIHPPETGWPSTDGDAHPAVTLVFTCGHNDDYPVDADIVNTVLLFVGRAYIHREAVVTGTIVTEYPHVYNHLYGHRYRDFTDYSDQV